MTDEELSRMIAELLEPLKSLPGDDDADEMQGFPCECWIATFRLSQVTGLHVPCWAPRDMVNNAEMTLMLMEKIPPNSLIEILHFDENLRVRVKDGHRYKVIIQHGLKTIGEARAATLGRAVAEAFADANELAQKEKETK